MLCPGSLLALCALLPLSTGVLAAYEGNVNYRSPSLQHDQLGIDLSIVRARSSQNAKHAKRDDRPYDPSELEFTHGVASGDPYADSVILWTRIAPTEKASDSDAPVTGSVPLYDHDSERWVRKTPFPICVEYRVFKDKDGKDVVDEGEAYTTSDIDWTVKVEAKNLQPFTTYYYRFNICGSDKSSVLGRTKTSPGENDDVDGIKFAVYSCANYPTGHFNAYGNVVRKDSVDFVLHLGDYLYEYSNGIIGWDERAHYPQRMLFSLEDYRGRYGQYRSDIDLAQSHQNFAWIPIWDDHEVGNNAWKGGFDNLHNNEASFMFTGRKTSVDQRRMNAVRAYFEWMPLRQVDMDDGLRIWRSFKMGKLMDLVMIDTRQYDRSITHLDLGANKNYIKKISNDASRSLMGNRQENWFYRSLSDSHERNATWRVIGDQLRFARLDGDSMDSWDGYRANQNRTLQHLYDNEIPNNILLAGDTHQNWVSDVAWVGEKEYDHITGRGAVGVEFAGTAVTSHGMVGTKWMVDNQSRRNAKDYTDLQWTEGYYRGYYELHVTPAEVHAQYFGCPTVSKRTPWELPLANFTVKEGDNHLQRPVAGGKVEAGYLRDGEVENSHFCVNTETGQWKEVEYSKMYISLASLIPI